MKAIPFLLFLVLFASCSRVDKRIVGDDMLPNFEERELYMVDKSAFDDRPIKRWETVYFADKSNGSRHNRVLRVAGLPGDVVKINQYGLKVNGLSSNSILWNADYRVERDATGHAVMDSYKVPEGMYFLLGDNFAIARDSRHFGPISREEILGLAIKL